MLFARSPHCLSFLLSLPLRFPFPLTPTIQSCLLRFVWQSSVTAVPRFTLRSFFESFAVVMPRRILLLLVNFLINLWAPSTSRSQAQNPHASDGAAGPSPAGTDVDVHVPLTWREVASLNMTALRRVLRHLKVEV